MKEIGGYFELELLHEGEPCPHIHSMALNTGRNALEAIIRNRKYNKIWIPWYCCDAILEPIFVTGVQYGFYEINEKMEPVEDLIVNDDEALLCINYFGLKNSFIKGLKNRYTNIIVDNTQAFFSLPCLDMDTFYSCRKFFGVPDGAFLYTKYNAPTTYALDHSELRMSHLIGRAKTGAENNYQAYLQNEKLLEHQPIKRMSSLTKALMKNIDYAWCCETRNHNFMYLHNILKPINELAWIDGSYLEAPMAYPFLIKDETLRSKLIDRKIFVPTYWPELLSRCTEGSWEHYLAKYLLPLPIDQRYSYEDMNQILEVIV